LSKIAALGWRKLVSEAVEDHSLASSVLVEKDGRFYFYQPGLGVIGSAESVSAAYERFLGLRRDYLEEARRAGLTAIAALPSQAQVSAVVSRPHFLRELQLFVAKTAIVLVVLSVLGMFVGALVGRAVHDVTASVGGIQPVSMKDVVDKAADIVKDLKSLSPERRESFRQSIGTISQELEPMVEAWRKPPEVPSTSQK
jgi:hypothetical protein